MSTTVSLNSEPRGFDWKALVYSECLDQDQMWRVRRNGASLGIHRLIDGEARRRTHIPAVKHNFSRFQINGAVTRPIDRALLKPRRPSPAATSSRHSRATSAVAASATSLPLQSQMASNKAFCRRQIPEIISYSDSANIPEFDILLDHLPSPNMRPIVDSMERQRPFNFSLSLVLVQNTESFTPTGFGKDGNQGRK